MKEKQLSQWGLHLASLSAEAGSFCMWFSLEMGGAPALAAAPSLSTVWFL